MIDQKRTPEGTWPTLGKFWTIPNVMSLSRLIITIPITYLILTDGSLGWIFVLFLLAVLSDYLDGYLARRSHTVSEWGKVLDPFADKVGGGTVLVALAIKGALPWWFIVVVLGRDVLILLGGLVLGRRTGIVVVSRWWGKVTVAALAATVLAALLEADAPVLQACIWTSTLLVVYSFIRYLLHYLPLTRAASPAATEAAATIEAGAEASN